MTRILVLGHDHLEAVDGAGKIAVLQVVAACDHFLGGELVAGDIDLAPRTNRIFRFGILTDDLAQRFHRGFGAALVMLDIRNFVEQGGCREKLRIGSIGAAGMQREIASCGNDSLGMLLAFVVGVGRHQERLAAPLRIGVLAVDFLELLRGFLEVLLVQKGERLVVQQIGRLIGQKLVFLLVAPQAAKTEVAETCAAGKRNTQRQDDEHPECRPKTRAAYLREQHQKLEPATGGPGGPMPL